MADPEDDDEVLPILPQRRGDVWSADEWPERGSRVWQLLASRIPAALHPARDED